MKTQLAFLVFFGRSLSCYTFTDNNNNNNHWNGYLTITSIKGRHICCGSVWRQGYTEEEQIQTVRENQLDTLKVKEAKVKRIQSIIKEKKMKWEYKSPHGQFLK